MQEGRQEVYRVKFTNWFQYLKVQQMHAGPV